MFVCWRYCVRHLVPTVLAGAAFQFLGVGCGGDGDSGDGLSCREDRAPFIVVRLQGSAYEMGYQHGVLLRDEVREAVEFLQRDIVYWFMLDYGRNNGIVELAEQCSYPDLLEECRGFVDATADVGMTLDICLLLNFGDVLVERMEDASADSLAACVGIAVSGAATKDGRLYHGRILDWGRVKYILDYPVIFVRRPDDGLVHVVVGFPGNISPYQGMNESGVVVSSNEVHPGEACRRASSGRSHVQMVGQVLKHCRGLDEAEAFICAQEHMSAETLVVSDGNSGRAAVFELCPSARGVRRMDANGLVYAANHFLAPETSAMDSDPTSVSSLMRQDRMSQLLEPGAAGSLYGGLDAGALVQVLRDRVDPWTGEEYGADVFDNGGKSLATHACVYEIVFDPGNLVFWVAAGGVPVPSQRFVGFSLGEMAHLSNAVPASPAFYADLSGGATSFGSIRD